MAKHSGNAVVINFSSHPIPVNTEKWLKDMGFNSWDAFNVNRELNVYDYKKDPWVQVKEVVLSLKDLRGAGTGNGCLDAPGTRIIFPSTWAPASTLEILALLGLYGNSTTIYIALVGKEGGMSKVMSMVSLSDWGVMWRKHRNLFEDSKGGRLCAQPSL